MRILLVQESGKYGGGNKMLYWLASMLHNNGFNVTLTSFRQSENIAYYCNGWKFISLNLPSTRNFLKRNTFDLILGLYRFWKLVKGLKPDVVISFGDHSFYQTFLITKLLKTKFIISERVDPYSSRSLTEKIRRRLYNYADGAVFQTQKAMEFFSEKLQKRSVVIPNPVINSTYTLNEPWTGNDSNEIVYIGRIDNKQKRLDILISAFNIVHMTWPDCFLNIYGDGTSQDLVEVKKQISEMGLENSIIFKGVTHNVRSILAHAKLFVLTSDFEGIPNSVIEAMQAGIPIVATDCSPGGVRILLGDSEFGTIVEKGDYQSVADGILSVLNDSVTAMNKAKNASASLDRFNETTISAMWLSYIKGV